MPRPPSDKKKQVKPRAAPRKRAIPAVKGHGDYLSSARGFINRYVPRGTLASAGGAIGGMYGNSAAGRMVGRQISRISGVGDYKVRKNSLVNSGDQVPQFSVSGKRANVVVHREYIQDVTTGSSALVNAATPFQASAFSINPGQEQVFPWLNTVAQCYEEYVIHGIIFEFKSTSATALNSTNTALGTVIMMTNYNANDPAPLSKQQMENQEFTTSTKPSNSCMHTVECARRETVLSELYVRPGAAVSGQDLRFSDLGTFYIATVGMQAINTNIGELWVTYEIELLKPKLFGGQLGYGINVASYHNNAAAGNIGFYNLLPSSTNNMLLTFPSAGTFNFPSYLTQGTYIVQMAWFGSAGTVAPLTLTGVNCNVTKPLLFDADTVGQFNGGQGTTSAVLSIMVYVTITAPSATVTISGSSYPVSVTNIDLVVSQTNASVVT